MAGRAGKKDHLQRQKLPAYYSAVYCVLACITCRYHAINTGIHEEAGELRALYALSVSVTRTVASDYIRWIAING